MRDLSRELVRQGHQVTVLLPAADLETPWRMEDMGGVRALCLKAPPTRDVGYVRRAIGEFLTPFAMLRNLRRSPLAMEKWDGVAWYSPSIFHGYLVSALKKSSRCKGYLIIRDIFPEWAADVGLIGRGLPYRFFAAVARYQYAVADIIGVQTPSNRPYFAAWRQQPGRKLEVLQNWLDKPVKARCPIRVDNTPLTSRRIFVYAGNMGIAQGMDILIDLARQFATRADVGFLFVGRGSEAQRLKNRAQAQGLTNVLFYDEIEPDEIPDLYAQCHAGVVALDPRHKSHNIPGKFLTYMQSGLPVLANVNEGNDLAALIRSEQVGEVCENNQIADLAQLANKLLIQIETDSVLSSRCSRLFAREFSAEQAARQVVRALSA
jgi:glycosyltransferase involved in cell wall biosynthesis